VAARGERVDKAAVKSVVHRALKRPPLEELLRETYLRGPDALRRLLPKVVPQPRTYDRAEVRRVTRDGFSLVLHPSAYFQWHHYFGFEDPVLETLKRMARHARVILDVGANIGMYSLAMARAAGPEAQLHAFEPHPATFRHLDEHRALNDLGGRLRCHELACGARAETLTIHEAGTRDEGKSSLQRKAGDGFVPSFQVRVAPVDALVEELALPSIDLMKVDVEGHEPEVFLGARASLERFAPLLCFELSPEWYADRAALAQQAFGGLGALGYDLLRIRGAHRPGPLATPFPLDRLLEPDARAQLNLVGLPRRRPESAALRAELTA
jgi:FkbM family methyltransferase